MTYLPGEAPQYENLTAKRTVQPLFENAGVWSRRDDGFFDVSAGKDAAASFIETCGKLRFWDRESVKQD